MKEREKVLIWIGSLLLLTSVILIVGGERNPGSVFVLELGLLLMVGASAKSFAYNWFARRREKPKALKAKRD